MVSARVASRHVNVQNGSTNLVAVMRSVSQTTVIGGVDGHASRAPRHEFWQRIELEGKRGRKEGRGARITSAPRQKGAVPPTGVSLSKQALTTLGSRHATTSATTLPR